jgi:hypothetical protein
VAAFGSRKVGVFSTAALADDSFEPDAGDHVELSGGGPAGLALDELRGRLYVWTRFDDSIAIVDLGSRQEIAKVALPSPEPAVVRDGRAFLYDARLTSSNGEASCSGCHVFGDFDGLGWDLGDPDGAVVANPNPFEVGSATSFHPLKGPMATQTLRGLANHGPMHWRGDRTGATPGNSAGAFDEQAAFEAFNVAFTGLLGRTSALDAADMTAFARFALEIVSPPNPIRNLDGSFGSAAQNGSDFYHGPVSDFLRSCNGCHVLDATQGFFGANGESSFDAEPQDFKIAHFRNVYQKVGRFDVSGPQIRGFGYLHDGSVDTILRFLRTPLFVFPGSNEAQRDVVRHEVIDFLMRFPGELAPAVGQQTTLDAINAASAGPRIDLLIARAEADFALAGEPAAKECDLVVKGGGHGWLYDPSADLFSPDSASGTPLGDAALRVLAAEPGSELTYTCMPPGSGPRAALDRDQDGELDADDNCPGRAPGGELDGDGDGRGAACDNCPDLANPGQGDAGGWGAGSLADGRGDACQCGDPTDDGVVTQADVDELRGFLAGGIPALTRADKCNVVGAPGSGEGSCDLADSAALQRRLAGETVASDLDICSPSAP